MTMKASLLHKNSFSGAAANAVDFFDNIGNDTLENIDNNVPYQPAVSDISFENDVSDGEFEGDIGNE